MTILTLLEVQVKSSLFPDRLTNLFHFACPLNNILTTQTVRTRQGISAKREENEDIRMERNDDVRVVCLLHQKEIIIKK